jgi:Type I phosphodiesterase / nucleotide pyrophosphatase
MLRLSRTKIAAAAAAAGLVGIAMILPAGAWGDGHGRSHADGGKKPPERRVLLISVDGLHQSDLAWYVQTHPRSTLAHLVNTGTDYSDASTPFPSDSFPGFIGQVTGGNPASTGVYYDDTWNHAVFPAGTTNCSGPAPGGEVTYFEALDKNLGALDAGQGIVPAPGPDPWANILHMTGQPKDVIDPTKLPVDAKTCKPIFPNQYLQTNTIFEVAHDHNLVTAWSDKHPAYQIIAGPSGTGVNDFFTPEINSSANPAAPTDPNQNDWTTDNLKTQQYDNYKVQAVLDWIDGHRHDGSGNLGTPAIFGMNFQSVSTAQKLPTSTTEGNTSGTAPGGYLADGFTPGPVLVNALNFVDDSLAKMLNGLDQRHLRDSTDIIISAKHGQSPMNPAALNRIKDSTIIDALNAAWAKHHAGHSLVPFSVNDDGMLLWFDNQWRHDPTAAPFAKNFLQHYNIAGGSVDGKDITAAGLSQIYAGADAARLFNVTPGNPRVPDLVGISQYGVVYTGKKAKIAEHGGDHPEDRNVPIVISGPGIDPAGFVTTPVETTQIAPTILQLLGINPHELQAVANEGTSSLLPAHNDHSNDKQD